MPIKKKIIINITNFSYLVQGFDEYMNVVIDDAYDIIVKKNERRHVGRILLKGDCITLIQRVNVGNMDTEA